MDSWIRTSEENTRELLSVFVQQKFFSRTVLMMQQTGWKVNLLHCLQTTIKWRWTLCENWNPVIVPPQHPNKVSVLVELLLKIIVKYLFYTEGTFIESFAWYLGTQVTEPWRAVPILHCGIFHITQWHP